MTLPNFDYGSLTTYTLHFTARDYLYTSDNKTLTIVITDVNEAPQFVVSAYTDRIPEELVGLVFGIIGVSFEDKYHATFHGHVSCYS